MKQYPWLKYSKFGDDASAVPVPCLLQAVLVTWFLSNYLTAPFRTWTLEKEYHQCAVTTIREFLTCYQDLSLSVRTMLDSQAKRAMDSNFKVIKSLLKITILFGKLAMRGHQDDRVQWGDPSYPSCR